MGVWILTATGQQFDAAPAPYVAGEVLVRFRADASTVRRNAAVGAQSARLLRRFDAIDLQHLRLRTGQTVDAAMAAFRADPDVLSVQPNYVRYLVATGTPNDPSWLDDSLWGLRKIMAQAAWTNLGTGDGSVVIADIDSGVNYYHPDLAANMWINPGEIPGNGIDDDHNGYVDDVFGIDTVNHDSDPMDDNGHGTHTAGTIGAVGNNGIGVVGVNWKAKILACKFINSGGSGTDAGAAECFNYITALKNRGVNIRVSSNSWGASRATQALATALKSAIDGAGNAGILNVFAAGNAGTNNDVAPFDPASFTSASVVSVAASDSGDNRAGFSNYGLTSVDLAAPGVSIRSTYGSGYADLSGTSMATPHVAGAAALLFSQKPVLTVAAAKALLLDNVDQLGQWTGLVASGGRLNVFGAALANSSDIPPVVSITSPGNGASLTVPPAVTVTASATDSDGTVSSVAFYANGTLIGVDMTSPYSVSWSPAASGAYTLTAVATDNIGISTTSAAISVNLTAPPGRVNVALAANGAKALASSTYNAGFAPSGAINGDRKGLQWNISGGWNDATSNAFPDWLEVDFNGPKTINEIDVFSLQDNYQAAVEPTPNLTFSLYGLTAFQVQYWDGAQWLAVPGGTISGNSLVWRQVNFSPVVTSRIRVWITGALGSWSRVTEVEAYQIPAPPTVSLTAPANNATLTAPGPITLTADAADVDGTVSSVAFYANGGLLGTDTTSPYSLNWSNVAAGTYTLTAVATDNLGASTTSAAVSVTVMAPPPPPPPPTSPALPSPPGRVNVALASNGATASASSTYSYNNGFAPGGAINGDRRGFPWSSGGGWNDATPTAFPDWLEIDFNGPKTINEVDVFSLQDDYLAPVEPTPNLTFGLYGLTTFQVQYWDGAKWLPVPGGDISGNTLVWRQVSFSPLTTSRIRVWISGALGIWSRVLEVEAYQSPTPLTVSLTAPANNATLIAPGPITLTADAADTAGKVKSVAFYANGTPLGVVNSSPYVLNWTNVSAGNYSLTAIATNNLGASTMSSPASITVTPPRVNVALAANGATALASSVYSYNNGFAPGAAINGDRKGLAWDVGGGWNDGTPNVFPDWLEVDFKGSKTINEVDIFSVQDGYKSPTDPTTTQTFSLYGLTSFQVQYWDGAKWLPVPGGDISGNTLVWRQVTFSPLTTSRIRLWITGALTIWSRVAEIEAYQVATTTTAWQEGPPLPPPAGSVVNVSTEAQLQAAVKNFSANTTIVVAPGTYQLTSTLWINGDLPNVGIRGATENRDDVVLVGPGMSNADYGSVPFGIWTGNGVRGITIANLTIRDVYFHPIVFNAGTQSPHVHNVHLIDAGQQFIKSNPDGVNGGVNDGIVEYSVLEYSETANSDYTNGVDVHTGANWIIRQNLFRNIVAPPGQLAGPAVLLWNHSSNTLTEGNTFQNCTRGISYGLIENGGSDHFGGIIRNNVFFRASDQAGDVGILVADSPYTHVLNNTVFVSGTYSTPIEYRFAGASGIVLANNLLDGAIAARDGATGITYTNLEGATASMFVDAASGDLHLGAAAVNAIDRGTWLSEVSDDVDGTLRPQGKTYDIGADEYSSALLTIGTP